MYTKILVPVDLTHVENLTKAIDTAAELAKIWKCELCYVGVTPETPSPVAHNPKEYGQKLAAFAKEQGESHGVAADSIYYTSTDPAIDVNKTLKKAIQESGADLVVMASHMPNVTDYVWASHGGWIAEHSETSVFIVR
ncbi:universal stress protein UspA [Rhodobacteraceae bacterium WD3A24]|nr:universal stress protein UspA [Rhodobacteraceae bacterium WD3A24]